MAISKKIKEYLESEKIDFEVLEHATTFTASETAGAQHVPGQNFLKVVIVNFDEKPLMCVLTAAHLIDFDKLHAVLGANNLELASEEEIGKLFPDYEVGAEPPFGNLYGLDVFLEQSVMNDEWIAFNGGTHTDIVKMKREDFVKLVSPTIAEFGKHV